MCVVERFRSRRATGPPWELVSWRSIGTPRIANDCCFRRHSVPGYEPKWLRCRKRNGSFGKQRRSGRWTGRRTDAHGVVVEDNKTTTTTTTARTAAATRNDWSPGSTRTGRQGRSASGGEQSFNESSNITILIIKVKASRSNHSSIDS